MKTAISVPDEIYERAERLAKKHGMNRSQFYATAAEKYADELDADDLTAAIDVVVDTAHLDASVEFAVAAGERTLEATDDEW